MVWSNMANDTKERWQKVMELSSNNGSGLWEGHLWNSQLKLAEGNPVPSSPYQCCDWPNHIKPPYITETRFSCHITSASMRIDSVILKMEAVRSSEIGRFNHNALQKLNSLLTYSMVQSPSWEANWFAASQEIPRILWNLKVHYRTHKHPPLVPILRQPNPVHIPTSHLLEIHPNIIHPSTPRSPQWSLSLRFPHQ